MAHLLLRVAAMAGLVVGAAATPAADLAKINRSITHEPYYETRAPRYCLLVFGPEAKERVWLVLDGDYLYVDRNGNGDLTESGERLRVTTPNRDPAKFDSTELKLNGKLYGFQFEAFGWSRFRRGHLNACHPHVAVSCDDGRRFAARGDVESSLTFTESPRTAPIVHIGGPLHMGVEGTHPLKKVGAGKFELNATVGTTGLGAGTFAHMSYNSIPDHVNPEATLEFPNADPRQPPVTVHMQLKKRC